MIVLFIDHWTYDEAFRVLKVEAIVEDAAVVRKASRDEPEELGPALCSACMLVEPGEWPEDAQQQIEWLEARNPGWTLINKGEWQG